MLIGRVRQNNFLKELAWEDGGPIAYDFRELFNDEKYMAKRARQYLALLYKEAERKKNRHVFDSNKGIMNPEGVADTVSETKSGQGFSNQELVDTVISLRKTNERFKKESVGLRDIMSAQGDLLIGLQSQLDQLKLPELVQNSEPQVEVESIAVEDPVVIDPEVQEDEPVQTISPTVFDTDPLDKKNKRQTKKAVAKKSR